MSEDFPFNNQYYNLIKGKTLSKRGVWWTAVLLVEGKDVDDENEPKSTSQKITKKVIIQRWRRYKQGDDGFRWGKSKDFAISSKKQWEELKSIMESWLEDGSWD